MIPLMEISWQRVNMDAKQCSVWNTFEIPEKSHLPNVKWGTKCTLIGLLDPEKYTHFILVTNKECKPKFCTPRGSMSLLREEGEMALKLPHGCHEKQGNYLLEQIVPEFQWRLDVNLQMRR